MKMTKCTQNSYNLAILTNFQPIIYSKVVYTTNEIYLKAHILPKVSKNYYYQKMYLFLTILCKNVHNVPFKSYISGHFDQFLNPLIHSKALYTTIYVRLRSHILQKDCITQYYQKLYSFHTLMKGKSTKCAQKSYIWPF